MVSQKFVHTRISESFTRVHINGENDVIFVMFKPGAAVVVGLILGHSSVFWAF